MNHEQERPDALNSSVVFLAGLVAGAAIGAGIGLLCAPRKGSELRERMSDAATSVGNTVSRTVDDLTQLGRHTYGRARDIVSRTGSEIDRMAAAAAKGVEETASVSVR